MRIPLATAAVGAALLVSTSAPLEAQNSLFTEDFNSVTSGLPSGWQNFAFGYSDTSDKWRSGTGQIDGTRTAFHEFFCDFGFFFRDNRLVAPTVDLSGLTQASLDFDQFQLFPLSRVLNSVEVSTDGGTTYTEIWRETTTVTGISAVSLPLDAFAGQPIEIGFHYQGVISNEWYLDNVDVNTASPVWSIANLVGGQNVTLSTIGCQPSSTVFSAFSLSGTGPLPTPIGSINLTFPFWFFANTTADGAGVASQSFPVPVSATGLPLFTQAVEVTPTFSTNITNSRSDVIG